MLSQQKNSEKLREIFKQRLRSVMQRRGIQSNELAEKLGVSEGAVSNWMNGRNFAKGRNLRDLADFTGCPREWFFEAADYDFDPAISAPAQAREEPAPAVSRENCMTHLEKFLDTCENDPARIGWTSVVLRETFPLDKWRPALLQPSPAARTRSLANLKQISDVEQTAISSAAAAQRLARQESERKQNTGGPNEDKSGPAAGEPKHPT